MSRQAHPLSVWQLFVIASASLLCSGWHSAFGQCLPGEPNCGISNSYHASNPKTNARRFAGKRPENRPDEKQQAVEQAIEEGNRARDKNDYEQALAHYQKVANELNPKEARAFYGMGNLYSDLYCSDSAIEAYGKALELKQDYPEARISLGYAYVGKERYDEAEEQFQAALKFKPVDANLGLGYVYAKKGKYQEAIDRINNIINDKSVEDKDRATAYFVLGAIYEQQNKWQDAIAQYEKAISLLRQVLTAIEPDKIAQHEKVMSLKHALAPTYLSLGSAQLTYAFHKQPAFGDISQLGTKELEVFRTSIKQASDNLDRAKEHGYNNPYFYIAQGRALAFQSNYQEAIHKISIYFEKVKELESSLSPLAKKCNFGLNLLNADGHWWLGDFYYLEGQFEADEQKKTELFNKAADQFKQAVTLRQDFDTAYLMLGSIYEKQKNYEEAIRQYQNAIRFGTEKSGKAQAYEGVGEAYNMLKRYDEAISNVQEAIRLESNNPSFYESLASIYVAQGNTEETFKLLKKATELRTELKLESAADSGPYFYLGATYGLRFLQKRDEEDFNEAVRWVKKAIEIRPKNSIFYRAMGSIYLIHSNADEAIANYTKAIEYDPNNPDNYFNMADVYSDLKHNYDAAIERIKQVIALKPDSARAYQCLGAAYHHKNDDTEAIKQELKAIEIDPKYLQAHLDLAEIYKTRKNYSEAIQHLQSAIGIMPTDFYPYKELAKIYEEQQKNEDAIHYYEEAIKLLDANAQTKNFLWTKNLYLGRIERLRGHYAEAISYFQKLPQPPSEGPLGQTQYDIGLTYIAGKNKKAALEQYQQLVQLKSPLAEELLEKIKEMK